MDTVRLLISCPDTRGIIASVTAFIADYSGNIVELDQHTDSQSERFYMRIEIEAAGFGLPLQDFSAAWEPLRRRLKASWQVRWPEMVPRIVILASTEGHCLHDLLYRWRAGELRATVPLIISNHADLADIATASGVRFEHVPIVGGDKAAQERTILSLVGATGPELIVLARYMQILSPEFVKQFEDRIINIHHSFLPAFAGPRPYHQAFERGVKIIGATSHYVTEELDEGPIISQQTSAIGHRDTVQTLIRKGRDLERNVLAHAVRLHLEDRVIVDGRKTIIFD